ncbi:hypothetical protein Ccrd_010991 [Cynara cardunculus var. scolymus]|uniref:Cardiolipin synthase N-terminal domain-containing protein n=1 Tax=Cynara cardunculus var. scolymus TaxID=59895 RepID=A0A103YK46_CYNCS|nr:hypothetical protein Ccrd_010991 [Cynara cardunculus var. scolymus]
MFARTTLISCNFSSFHSQNPKIKLPFLNTSTLPLRLRIITARSKYPQFIQRGRLQICRNSIETQKSQDPDLEQENSMEIDGGQIGGGGGDRGGGRTTSFLIFLLWGGLMYYVFNLAPNQTPSTDMYLLKKLCYLTGDDGFQPNQVIVSIWNIMGLWPLVYSMLLMPSGRSSKGNVPVSLFLILSWFLGAYALILYFVIWRPPPPATEESELKRWPLNFLESKLTAGIHATTIDFALLSSFAPFWVYNDMTARKWNDKGFWLLPVSLIPFLGPALYVLLRPSLPAFTKED